MRRVGRVALLASIWVLLWGRVSVANVASGLALSSLLLVLYPPPTTAAGPWEPFVLRPVHTVHLAGYILAQVLSSNVQIARRILTPRSRLRSGVVTFEFRTHSKRLITFISTVLAISPGTMPVRVDTEPPFLAVHVLHLKDPDATRRAIARLEELTIRAFGTRAAREVVA